MVREAAQLWIAARPTGDAHRAVIGEVWTSGSKSRRRGGSARSVRCLTISSTIRSPPALVSGQPSMSALSALRSAVLASSLTRSRATSATMMRPTSSFTVLKMPRAFMLSVWRWLSSVGVR